MDGEGWEDPQKIGIQSVKIAPSELGFSLLQLFYDVCLLHEVRKGMTQGLSMIIFMRSFMRIPKKLIRH